MKKAASDDMVTIRITRKAADCLAWWAHHPFYADDLSGVIVDQMQEWLAREHKTWESAFVDGEYEQWLEGQVADSGKARMDEDG